MRKMLINAPARGDLDSIDHYLRVEKCNPPIIAPRPPPRGIFFSALCGTTTANPPRQSPFPIPKSPLGYRVGYATEALADGNQSVCAQFVRIGEVDGKRGTYLTELQFDFNGATKVNGDLQIQRLNKDGVTIEWYKYYAGQGSRSKYKVDGWYNMADDSLITKDNDVFFPAGEGLYMSGVVGYKLTTSGEVLTESVTTTFTEDGNMMLANPYPVQVKLLDIELDANGATKVNGDFMIQRLDMNGVTTEWYKYYTNQGSRSKYKVDGWYDMKDDTLMTTENQPTFKAGEALYFGGKTDYKVTFKAPTL